jgi:hypothetical protein
MEGETQQENQLRHIATVKSDFEGRPDTGETKYIHNDHLDRDNYQYNELVAQKVGLEAKQHFMTVNRQQNHI